MPWARNNLEKPIKISEQFDYFPGWHPWLKMAIMLCHGMNLEFDVGHHMIMATSYLFCHGRYGRFHDHAMVSMIIIIT